MQFHYDNNPCGLGVVYNEIQMVDIILLIHLC